MESIPENLTYPTGSPSHLRTYNAWMKLLAATMSTLDIASFYWTLLGRGQVKDPTDKEVWSTISFTNFIFWFSKHSLYYL